MIAAWFATLAGKWIAGLVLLASLVGAGTAYHHHVYQQGFDAAVSDRAARDLAAVVVRSRDNAVLSIKQDAINAVLTRTKNEELAPVVARITTDRVHVGRAICDGPPAPAQAESAASSDSADPPGRLVPSNTERDFRALSLAVEEDLATGRACQAFITKNGLVP